MKKILNLLSVITLIGTSTTSLIACNKPQYSEEELKIWKQNNKINTNNQQIKDNLELITSQEKPFHKVDNKYYFILWRSNENADWRIIKFQNNVTLSHNWISTKIDNSNNRGLFLWIYDFKPTIINLCIYEDKFIPFKHWWDKSDNYFKAVYRWNLDKNIPNLVVDSKTNKVKVKNEEI